MMTMFELYRYARSLLNECENYLLQYHDFNTQCELTGARNDLVLFTSDYKAQTRTFTFPNVDRLYFAGFLACQEALDSFDALFAAWDDDTSAGRAA